MKKLYYLMAISCMFLSLPLTSCSDDDDDEVIEEATDNTTGDTTPDEPTTDEPVVEEYFGEEFNGTLAVNVGGEEQDPVSQEVYVLENEDGTITLTIKDFTFMFNFGDIVIENCPVAEDGSFSGEAEVIYAELGLDMTLTIEGTYNGTDLEFASEFNVPIGDAGLDVAFTFSTKEEIVDEAGGDEESDYTIAGVAGEYIGILTGSYSAFGYYGNVDPISDVTVSVGENAEGETVIVCDEEFTVASVVTISGLYINGGTIAEDGTFEGKVTVNYSFLSSATEETDDITGTFTTDADGNITVEASFSVAGGIASVSVKFTTVTE